MAARATPFSSGSELRHERITSTYILVPTSTEKRVGGTGSGWIRSFPEFDDNRHAIAEAATHYARSPAIRAVADDRRAMFERLHRNENVLSQPTMLALERYNNTLFRTIDHRSLPADSRRRLDAQLLIFSGMWGIVRPTDWIPDYCLSMTERIPKLGTLGSFWRHSLSATMNRIARDAVVWDLLPSATADVWAMGKHPTVGRRIFVRFQDSDGRDRNTKASSFAIRGALVRFLVENQPSSAAELDEFSDATGWTVNQTRGVSDGLRVVAVLTAPPN